MDITRSWPRRSQIAGVATIGAIAVGVVCVYWFGLRHPEARTISVTHASDSGSADDKVIKPVALGNAEIQFPRESWQAASLAMQPAGRAPLDHPLELTGKIALNEDHVAHIFPLVEGRVDEVKVQFGDKVKQGDLLVVVQSKEVGQAMLQLFQDRLQLDFAEHKNEWTQAMAENTRAMIGLIRDGAPIEQIEKQLQNRHVGEFREQLMSAYISQYKTRKHLDRLTPLSEEGAVTGKQLLEAETDWDAARASLQSSVEQILHEVHHTSLTSTHELKELQTRVAVDETNLKILGFDDAALASIDPAQQGETIAHYPVRAPFDGTIISKDVVLLERVGPEHQILSIADLSTVWIATDIYEEHLPLLQQLENQTIYLSNPSWPNQTFEAKIFYTGDVLDETTRTVSMRALADNREGLLKPGMFVNVRIPRLDPGDVVQVPATAVYEHEGQAFVFVHQRDDVFARREVTVGRTSGQAVEIKSGLKAGEMVVTSGGFALKSRMLADLLSEE